MKTNISSCCAEGEIWSGGGQSVWLKPADDLLPAVTPGLFTIRTALTSNPPCYCEGGWKESLCSIGRILLKRLWLEDKADVLLFFSWDTHVFTSHPLVSHWYFWLLASLRDYVWQMGITRWLMGAWQGVRLQKRTANTVFVLHLQLL